MNKAQLSIRPKDLELSLFTLWSLFILIDQNFKAAIKYKNILSKDYDLKNDDEVYLATIYEALQYQILLKGCSFLDEWDQVFGVKTEKQYDKKVRLIKSISKPARKFINSWKGLRDFRNQAIAHNHRDEKGNNIYFQKKAFHTPSNLADFALFIYCIEKMSKIAAATLYDEWQNAITKTLKTGFEYDHSKFKYLNRQEINDVVESIDKEVIRALREKFPAIINLSSDYGDFLLVAK